MRDAAEEIRIERQNHIRLFQLVLRVDVTAERRFDAAIADRGSPGPTGTTSPSDNSACTCFHCAASVGEVTVSLRKYSPCPPVAFFSASMRRKASRKSAHVAASRRDTAHAANGPDRTGPAASPAYRVRVAARQRVVRIAVHLDRPERRPTSPAPESRPSGTEAPSQSTSACPGSGPRGAFTYGKDRLVRLLGTTGQPGQRHRSAHHLQKAAPGNCIHPLRLPAAGNSSLHHLGKSGVSASSSQISRSACPSASPASPALRASVSFSASICTSSCALLSRPASLSATLLRSDR